MDRFDPQDGSVAYRIVAESELSFAILALMPITPGHTLIVPRRHVATIDELDENELLDLISLRARVCEALRASFDLTGFNFAWNEGREAGQSIAHLHLHVVPRSSDDAGIYGYEPRSFLYRPGSRAETPEDELAAIAKQLQNRSHA